MTLAVAEVVKRNTDDGVEFFYDDVPIGAKYLVDLDSRTEMEWYDTVRAKTTVRDSIIIVGQHSEHNQGSIRGYVPMELLAII